MTWEATVERARDVVSATASAALHGLLDTGGDPPGPGDPVPPLWHWLAFLPTAPQRDLGADGHPRTGGFLPPLGADRRRMWAGGALTFAAPLAVGEPIERVSAVTSVEEKRGRSGSLVFVTVEHDLGGGRVTERQDIVYRGASAAAPATVHSPPSPESGEDWTWEHTLVPDPTLLFRFSALTYNAHRIHYDRRYASEVEGYPGLVVHGPLQAIALAELCRRHLPEGQGISSFRFRAERPAFDGNPLRLCGRLDGDEATLVALDHHGHVTMRASASVAST